MSLKIVDADTHIIETAPIWDHIDQRDAQYRPQAIELEQGILIPPIQMPMTSAWVIDGQLYARTNLDVIERISNGQIKTGALSLGDPDERLKAMDRQGVDVHVIFPSLFLALSPDSAAVELALTRAYNRYLAEQCRGSKGRLRWVMQPAIKNIEASVEEIAWAARNGAIGVHMRGLEGDRPIDDPYFHPLFRAAEAHDLPICVHIGNASPSFRKIRRNAEDRPSRFHMSVPTLMSFTAIVMSDLHKLFPTLRFGFFEVGSSWLTYLVSQAHKIRDERDRKTYTQQIMRERKLYVTCEEHEELPLILQYAGDDHLVIGSDYGHPGDVDDSIYVQTKLRERADVPAEKSQKILSDNAHRLFGSV
jgi:predicted TIM-barrel fold metal-dependent hydrolase